MQNELTAEQKRAYDNGVRIFARWIARAYIRDMTDQKSTMNESETNIEKEKNNGDQGRIRDEQAASSGEDQAGRDSAGWKEQAILGTATKEERQSNGHK